MVIMWNHTSPGWCSAPLCPSPITGREKVLEMMIQECWIGLSSIHLDNSLGLEGDKSIVTFTFEYLKLVKNPTSGATEYVEWTEGITKTKEGGLDKPGRMCQSALQTTLFDKQWSRNSRKLVQQYWSYCYHRTQIWREPKTLRRSWHWRSPQDFEMVGVKKPWKFHIITLNLLVRFRPTLRHTTHLNLWLAVASLPLYPPTNQSTATSTSLQFHWVHTVYIGSNDYPLQVRHHRNDIILTQRIIDIHMNTFMPCSYLMYIPCSHVYVNCY